MGERSGDSSGLWSKANRALLPVWATYPLLLLGMWFVLLPFGIALGDPWFFYGFGLCVGTVVALLAGRFYRMTVLEQGDGLSGHSARVPPDASQGAGSGKHRGNDRARVGGTSAGRMRCALRPASDARRVQRARALSRGGSVHRVSRWGLCGGFLSFFWSCSREPWDSSFPQRQAPMTTVRSGPGSGSRQPGRYD